MRVFALALTLLLAGCAGSSPDSAPSTSPTTSATSGDLCALDATACLPRVMPLAEPIDHNGHLGLQAYVCHAQLPECQGRTITTDDCEIRIQHPGWTLVGGNVTATWTAESPATAELTLDFMVMGGANTTMLGTITGPSPLSLSVTQLNITLGPESIVHAYAYNQDGFTSLPDGGMYATPDQAVHLGGELRYTKPAG